MGSQRIRNAVVDVDQEQVRAFFEKRGEAINPASPLTSVLYQDKNPALAEERDAYERRKVTELLCLRGDEQVLDIGCGIGRWAQHLDARIGRGLGLDVSSSLVAFARTRPLNVPWAFETMSADEISRARLNALGFTQPFDLVILSGICIYLNDEMLDQMLRGICEVTRAGSVIYIREPIARSERLTLKSFWSEELNATYNAIYRTADDYGVRYRCAFGQSFSVAHHGPMYDESHLNNRSETFQYFWVLQRKEP